MHDLQQETAGLRALQPILLQHSTHQFSKAITAHRRITAVVRTFFLSVSRIIRAPGSPMLTRSRSSYNDRSLQRWSREVGAYNIPFHLGHSSRPVLNADRQPLTSALLPPPQQLHQVITLVLLHHITMAIISMSQMLQLRLLSPIMAHRLPRHQVAN